MKFSPKLLTSLIGIFLFGCNVAPVTSASVTPTQEPIAFKNTVVTLTFDDGDADNYQVRSVLKENNLHATFYVISGFTGTEGFMTADELRGLYEDGNEIGGHTVNHIKLSEVRGAELKREVCQNRLDLLAYNFDVRSFAYPYGYYDEEARQGVIECGYNSARIVTGGPENISPLDAYTLKAMPYMVRGTLFSKIKRYVTQTEENGGGWVIFTFHHICNKCDKFSTTPKMFSWIAAWLGEQQKNGLVIKTIGEVIGGEVKPGVEP
jgi:peptidoglycan/xylan/chitin deacetylase (PgdA/CDA1 family)